MEASDKTASGTGSDVGEREDQSGTLLIIFILLLFLVLVAFRWMWSWILPMDDGIIMQSRYYVLGAVSFVIAITVFFLKTRKEARS
jgi:uncharacterized membrane protein